MGLAEQYIAGVLDGTEITSKWVRKAVERHQKDVENGHLRGLRFDPSRAERVINFIEKTCRHSKGRDAGKPFILQGWQAALVWILFGWVNAKGYRRFRFALNMLARGSGKSTLAAAIGLYLLVADDEPAADVFSVATKKEQAKLVHGEATRMVAKSPLLRKRVTTYRDSLSVTKSFSKFVPLASDSNSLDGLNIHCAIADECHAWKGRELYDVLVTALGKRNQPLFFIISTAGYDRHSVFHVQYTYSTKVLNGEVQDDSWFAWLASIDDDDDPFDETCWVKANPGLPYGTVDIEELRQAAAKAQTEPTELNSFLRLRLNRWTDSHTAWMPMSAWDSCNAVINLEALKGRPCYAALDLSTTTDVSALVICFPPTTGTDKNYYVLPYFFIPKDNIRDRVQRDRVPYDVWVKNKLLITTEGSVIDYDVIRAKLNELAKDYKIQEIAYDSWNSSMLVTQLSEQDGFVMAPFRQGFISMSSPVKRIMELVLTGQLAHGSNPVLRWMASNAVAKSDPAGLLKLDKSKSQEKIDGMVALAMALGRAEANLPKTAPKAGIFVI